MVILSWNILDGTGSRTISVLNDILTTYSPDVVILSETPSKFIIPEYIEVKLSGTPRVKTFIKKLENKFAIFQPLGTTSHKFASVFKCQFKSIDFILIPVHLKSKISSQSTQDYYLLNELNSIIELIRKSSLVNYDLLFIGDFNLNPYDELMIREDRLNSSPSLDFADANPVSNRNLLPRLYNPTWNLMGDYMKDVRRFPGSYFFPLNPKQKDIDHLYFNTLDQVLVTPGLGKQILKSGFQFIQEVNNNSLLKEGYPNKEVISDHLPLLISFDI